MLPTLPKADDYFLLRWLRGEVIGVREAESKGTKRKEQGSKRVRWDTSGNNLAACDTGFPSTCSRPAI